MEKQEWTKVIEKAIQDGEFAFWGEIIKHFPEVTGGDFDPILLAEMTISLKDYLEHWLFCNHPTYLEDIR